MPTKTPVVTFKTPTCPPTPMTSTLGLKTPKKSTPKSTPNSPNSKS